MRGLEELCEGEDRQSKSEGRGRGDANLRLSLRLSKLESRQARPLPFNKQ